MCGHWFYLILISATYTGVLGPFLISSASNMVTGFNSLKQGHHTVVVRGPTWDDKADEPTYLGGFRGGNSDENTPRSTQFKILQNAMNAVIWQPQSFVTDFFWIDLRLKLFRPERPPQSALICEFVAGLEDEVQPVYCHGIGIDDYERRHH